MKETLATFLWHMHQPDYTLPGELRKLLPWVRLHATKAYYDMPWLLQRHPSIKACINLSGSLLTQMVDYLEHGARDVWWDLTLKPAEALTDDERSFVLEHFFSINWDRQIKPIPGYWRLLQKRNQDRAPQRFSVQEMRDLQVYFNLAWSGFAARRDYASVLGQLLERGGEYAEEDKGRLLELQIEIMGKVLPMYRELAQRGQVELTTTPMFHPILPLLVDSDVARRATPQRPRPRRFSWPQDAAWHVESACAQFERIFGHRPKGMWPAEGSVSPEVIGLFARSGVRWIASDEDVLMASHPRHHNRTDALYRPYEVFSDEGSVAMVFRDHLISDLIGFTYASNSPQDAANDMLARIRQGGQEATATGRPLVPIVLDGENPWESYEDDGLHFLTALYEALEAAPDVTTVTVSQALDGGLPAGHLHHLHSGSWIQANYQIWIGAKETNAAWNLLGQTRAFVEETRVQRGLSDDDPALMQAMDALHSAEGSDWFWWYGDDFSSEQDKAFDSLFRGYLKAAYKALGQTPPSALHRSISTVQPSIEIIPQKALIKPVIDGVVASFFDWSGAGRYEPRGGAGSMYRARRYIKSVYFGCDLENFYLRIDPDVDLGAEAIEELNVQIIFHGQTLDGPTHVVRIPLTEPSKWTAKELGAAGPALQAPQEGLGAFARHLEVAIPFKAAGLLPGQTHRFALTLERRQLEIDRHPPHGDIEFEVPDEHFEKRNWFV